MFPLSGRPAATLCMLAGIPPDPGSTGPGAWTWALYENFECQNVYERHQPRWSAPEARRLAGEFLEEERPAVLVCLGRKVQRAVADALDFRAMRLHARGSRGGEEWGGGLFGSYGVWAMPWHVRMPVAGEDPEYAPAVVTIPHPSGLNRLLNDERHRALAGLALRQAMGREEVTWSR